MQAQYPDTSDSPKRREGDAAFWYITQALTGVAITPGTLAPNGHPVNQEMIDCADDVLRDITDTWRTAGGPTARIEEKVSAPQTVHPANDGRPDVYLLDIAGQCLHLWKYKYGHRYVDARMNWQCIDYAAMILESNGIGPDKWPAFRVTVTLAQPRNYHPDGPLREWYFDGAELVGYVAKLREAAMLTQVPEPMYQTGEHCRDCSARHACPALQRASMRLVDLAMTGQPIDLPPAALGLELRIIRDAIKRLGARAEGLEEQAMALAKGAVDIPWWRAEHSKGKERWRDNTSADDVILLGEMYGVDARKPVQTLTPNQLRKAGVDAEAVKGFAFTPSGALTLVPFDETDVAKRFS
jgi:hypothetical protein